MLEWGSHCVDLCQWAVGRRHGSGRIQPAERRPASVARYANGVELIFRETGWIPLGSCPVRFEGETGWVETGDSGKLVLSSPELLAGRTVAEIDGYPATFHVRDFLDCVKSRSLPKGNADAACYAHIACHAANIALYLGRQVKYDLKKNEFIGDEAGQPPAIRGAARTVEAVRHACERLADRLSARQFLARFDLFDPEFIRIETMHKTRSFRKFRCFPGGIDCAGRAGRSARRRPRHRPKRKGTDRRPALGCAEPKRPWPASSWPSMARAKRSANLAKLLDRRTAGLLGADRAGSDSRDRQPTKRCARRSIGFQGGCWSARSIRSASAATPTPSSP